MAKFTDKISNLINSQAPDFVLEQHPKFLEFIKTYYTFMESAELVVTSVQTTDGIQLETETAQSNTLLLDGSRIDSDRTQLDAGDKIILESSAFGKFTRGETITGQTSNATATVLGEDLTNNRLFISAQDKFIEGETILGASSNASAIINNYKPNPVTNIQELLNFRDPDKVISNFLTKFRNEFLNTLPETLNSGVDKRTLIKNVKSLYRAKGTAKAHEVFFRLLFGLQSETIYPRDQMLRVSDGKWTTNKILRTIQTSAQVLSGDTADLIGRTITGETSGATAIVENVFKFQIGPYQVVEFIINDDTITGTFQTDEVIRGTSTDDEDIFIKSTVTGIPSVTTISNDGSNYSSTDSISISGGGTGSIIQVDGVGRGGITEFIIDDGGSGYEIGDDLVFTNTNTGGGNASAKVSLVNGGFTQEDSTSTVDDHIVLEDETVRGDIYTGNKIVQESGTGSGDITDIRIITNGSNYITLPVVTVDDTNGSGASVFAYGSEIGRVQSLKIVESGAEYQQSPTPPTLTLPTYLLIADKSGDFVVGETVTGLDISSTVVTATVVSYNSSTGILKCSNASGTFAEETIITGDTAATATIKKADQATATVTVNATADTAGTYINEDGHVSENTMRIQDSLYYQDFSYVIKVGRTINDWRDSFKKTLHTSGFYFTGQVNLETQVSVQLQSITGINTGIDYEGPALILNTLFSTIFGRRLGTEDDGTTLRATPEIGVNPDFDATSTPDLFTSNTRDVTLTRKMKISFPIIVKQTVRGTEYKFGHAYAGPRMKTLDIYDNPFGSNNMFSGSHTNARTTAFTASGPGSTTMITPLKMVNWADHTIIGLNNSLNGTGVQIDDYNNDNLKTYITWPTEIRATLPGFTFDRTGTTYDTTAFTFDKTF